MTKNKKKNKSQKQRGVISFFLSLFLVILSLLLTFYFVLPSVFSDTKETKNIVLVSDNLDAHNSVVLIAHLDKNLDKNIIVSIDGSQIVNVGSSYGEYSLNTIYQLLKIDGKSDQKIKSVFSNILNISIDEVVVGSGISKEDVEHKSFESIFGKNLVDKFGNSFDNSINLLKFYFLADSMDIFKIDTILDLENIYYKLSTLDEKTYQNCSVSVVNTTSKNGLAQNVSEIIENTGARVMQVEGSDPLIEKTSVYYPLGKSECKQLVDRISGIFSMEIEINDINNFPLDKQFRSNVVVVIGENY
jgi:hypothetical protein